MHVCTPTKRRGCSIRTTVMNIIISPVSFVFIYIIMPSCTTLYCDGYYNAWRSFTSEVSDARGFRNYNIILRTLLYYVLLLAATVRFTWPIFARTSDQTAPKVVIACKTRTNECTQVKLHSARVHNTNTVSTFDGAVSF